MKKGDTVAWSFYDIDNNKCWYMVRTWSDKFILGGIVGCQIFAYWRIKSIKTKQQ